MLSQEELDKLLEGDSDEGSEDSGATEEVTKSESSESKEGPVSQDDIDALLSGASDSEDASDSEKLDEKTSEQEESSDDLDWGDAFAEAAEGGDSAAAKAMDEGVVEEVKAETKDAKAPSPPKPDAPAATFKDFADGSKGSGNSTNLDFILEIPLEVSVELGRSKMQIKDLLQLGQGSVVELNKVAGEPADIYVNQKLLAKGEVVVINDKFGVKLTEIISPADRVKSLG